MPPLYIIPFATYLLAALLLTRYFTLDNITKRHHAVTNLLLLIACISHAYILKDYWQEDGIFFGLVTSSSFISWVVATLLFLTSLTKPVHVIGILVYPLTAISVILLLFFPDTNSKLVSISIASHVFLSVGAYALLSIAVAQSILLKIQERLLHDHNINTFIDKLPPLQTMEDFLFQTLKMGCIILTLSLASGFIFVDEFFEQNLSYKTFLSVIAWVVFVGIVVGHKMFGWRGRSAILAIQVAFSVLVLAYFGTKLVLERLIT
ncbi:MAG: cytochrome c biogenesis protein CcsA [Gammaproteobacteria bacterium]|jgi:ABC-type uncharacterized transport system permease subunit|nr:cytochrome c biogenesis protein CcsA [Gammaproteobacteria bacterium]